MVSRADAQPGFDGRKEFPPVDPAFRDKCAAAVRAADAESPLEIAEFRSELTLIVRKQAIRAVCRALRDDPELLFNYLTDITAIDCLNLGRAPRFDVAYHLYSIPKRHRVRLRAAVEENDCRIDSVVEIWPAADWNERETYDMFGIVFDGHPNLTRILMPDDWQGFPLRKDFPLGGTKSFYFKKSTEPFAGETETMIPRIRPTGESDI